MLPGVLPVQDDRHGEAPRIVGQQLPDQQQPADQIVGRRLAVVRRVGEPDHVGEQVVAEEDVNRVGGVAAAVRQVFALRQKGIALAQEPGPAQGGVQDLLVGGHPADPFGAGDGQHLLGDGALRRPHPRRPVAEEALVGADRLLDVPDGVLGMVEIVPGQLDVGQGLAGGVDVAQERQDGVVVG